MSVEQYRRNLNTLDKDIADLRKKKATFDKKAADERKRAASVKIPKNASSTTLRTKMNEINRHESLANKAQEDSAKLAEKIADKTKHRNDAYLKLQKAEATEAKKQTKMIKEVYESRIIELESQVHMGLPSTRDDCFEQNTEEYDVFISHAYEDKESFVDELVEALKSKGARVWYDTDQLRWGDSMRAKIDEGLSHSRFGIIVLSPNYIKDGKYWTKKELNGLFQLESINGKVLLPIWHNLTKKELLSFSPMIADVKAMSTAIMTPEEIADELIRLLKVEE